MSHKIRPVGAELKHTDRSTEGQTQSALSTTYVNARKNEIKREIRREGEMRIKIPLF
jgi:hypothetical protein